MSTVSTHGRVYSVTASKLTISPARWFSAAGATAEAFDADRVTRRGVGFEVVDGVLRAFVASEEYPAKTAAAGVVARARDGDGGAEGADCPTADVPW